MSSLDNYKPTKKDYLLFAICMAFVFYLNALFAEWLIWYLDVWWVILLIGGLGIVASIMHNINFRFGYFITFSLVLWLIFIFMKEIFPYIWQIIIFRLQ